MIYIKYTKRNIRRTPYQALAATMIMFLTFLVMSSFLLLALGFQQILRFYESKPQAIAFFKDGTSSTDVKAIENALTQTGKITQFHFVSKDEALKIYRDRNKSNPMLLELVTANILPASLEISTQSLGDLKLIADIVKKEPVVEEVVFPEDVVATLTQTTGIIRTVGAVVVGFLITFSTLIIIMIIGFKIRIRRDEISITRLLGASSWFIRMPYVLEGLFYSSIGAILGWTASIGIVWYFEPVLINNLGDAAGIIFPLNITTLLLLLVIELLVALLVGGLGSLAAVRRYLHI